MLFTAGPASRFFATVIVAAVIAHSADAAATDDACSLLTPEQVGVAVGVPMGEGTYIMPTFKKTCIWNSTTSGGGTVTLNLQSLDQYDGGRKLASYGKSVTATSIGGIGDDAYYSGTNKLVSLVVKKGGLAFKLAVHASVSIDKQQAAERALALQIVSQL